MKWAIPPTPTCIAMECVFCSGELAGSPAPRSKPAVARSRCPRSCWTLPRFVASRSGPAALSSGPKPRATTRAAGTTGGASSARERSSARRASCSMVAVSTWRSRPCAWECCRGRGRRAARRGLRWRSRPAGLSSAATSGPARCARRPRRGAPRACRGPGTADRAPPRRRC